MGQSKVNKELEQSKLAAQNTTNQLLEKELQPTAGEQRLAGQTKNWDSWLAGKDYRVGPKDSILNFDQYMPAKENQLQAQYANINGSGGLALAQGGNATALGLAKQHQAATRAEQQSAGYENAVNAQNQYFQGNSIPMAQLEQSRNATALGTSAGREQFYTNAYVQTAPQPILPTLLGAAIGAGSKLLSPIPWGK